MTRDELERLAYEYLEGKHDVVGQYIHIDAEILADFALSVSGWTAVNEKLPETEGMYLVTVMFRSGQRISAQAWFVGDEDGGYWTSQRNQSIDGVVAWMPMPAPYEAKENLCHTKNIPNTAA